VYGYFCVLHLHLTCFTCNENILTCFWTCISTFKVIHLHLHIKCIYFKNTLKTYMAITPKTIYIEHMLVLNHKFNCLKFGCHLVVASFDSWFLMYVVSNVWIHCVHEYLWYYPLFLKVAKQLCLLIGVKSFPLLRSRFKNSCF